MYVTIICIASTYQIYRICMNEGKDIFCVGQVHLGMFGFANLEEVHWIEELVVMRQIKRCN